VPTTGGGLVIETENLTRKFGDLVAVDKLNINIREGDIYGFLGPNGAGKTTTIRMLSTLIRPTSGTARVMGHDILKEPNKVRRLIGIMPERPGFYEEMTGRKMLAFYGEFYRIPKTTLASRIEDLIDRVGMTRFIDARIKTYSHGMRKRLAIAQAMLHEPKILILDEASTGLDPKGVQEFRELIRSLAKDGYTIFLSSHVLPEVQQVCNRVGILRRGELVAEDTIENLRQQLVERSSARITVKATGVSKELVARVRQLDGVISADGVEWGMMVLAEPRSDVQADINDQLVKGGARIRSLTTLEPTLEDVFLDVTGGEGGV
jgi:ABC-2 type transport system ATP-binding protein